MSKLVHNYTANGSSTTDEYGTQLVLNRIFSGDVIEGFLVVANGTPNMTVRVNPGSGRISTGTYPSSYGYLISHDTAAGESVTISPAAASPRIDYVVAYIDKSVAGSTAPADVNNTNNVLKFVAVAGTPAGSPNPPTISQIQTAIGASNPYIILAQVAVGAGVVLISNGNISDMRTFASLAINSSGSGGWIGLPSSVSSVTYNGNRSYSLTMSADSTSLISPGMRLRTTRTVAVPTQSSSLNGSQYFNRSTTINGMTFTNNFVVSAWIKLGAYSTTRMCIVSRKSATNGWYVGIDNGRVVAYGLNGSASNYSDLVAPQALPLNKWVHIAIQLDMASFTVTPTTSYVMIDGLDVPAVVSRGGTNPTSLVQGGNIEIGSTNSGTELFTGKIAQVAVYGSKVTQATIRTTASQSLTGSETSLVSAWSLSNSLNDFSTNANHLTSQNSATTTNADAPWGVQANGAIDAKNDYAIVQTISPSVITVQVPEGGTIPTAGGLSGASYSSFKSPYGFPAQKDKWNLYVKSLVNNLQSSPTANVWYQTSNTTPTLNVPIGEWNLKYECLLGANTNASAGVVYSTLSNASSSETIKDLTGGIYISTANTLIISPVYREYPQSVSAMTPYYHIFKSDTAINNISIRSDIAPLLIVAENTYL